MSEHFNKLTPAEDERLAWLSEECSEVIKAICKIQRHGYESFNPDDPDAGSNRNQLCVEMGHVQAAINLLTRVGDVNYLHFYGAVKLKKIKIKRYFHHQE